MSQHRTRLLLVRHGQTPWNAAGRWQGFGDPGLTPLGRDQARELAAKLRVESQEPWHRIIASDLERARETASILAESLALSVEIDLRLRELDVGNWTGLTRSEIETRDPETLRAFESGEPSIRPGEGESRIEIRVRTRDCVRDLAERYPGEGLIVVTHLGVIRALVPGAEPDNASYLLAHAEEISEREIDRERRPSDGPL
jgi:broad specificity phosphatase PhoE